MLSDQGGAESVKKAFNENPDLHAVVGDQKLFEEHQSRAAADITAAGSQKQLMENQLGELEKELIGYFRNKMGNK